MSVERMVMVPAQIVKDKIDYVPWLVEIQNGYVDMNSVWFVGHYGDDVRVSCR